MPVNSTSFPGMYGEKLSVRWEHVRIDDILAGTWLQVHRDEFVESLKLFSNNSPQSKDSKILISTNSNQHVSITFVEAGICANIVLSRAQYDRMLAEFLPA